MKDDVTREGYVVEGGGGRGGEVRQARDRRGSKLSSTSSASLSLTDSRQEDEVCRSSSLSSSGANEEDEISPSSTRSSSTTNFDEKSPETVTIGNAAGGDDDDEDYRDDGEMNEDLRTKPSWCDANFALEQIRQGKAEGSMCSLKLRRWMQSWLFALGDLVSRRPVTVILISLMVLGLGALGWKDARMEMDVEKLWVETGGKLQKELEHSRMIARKYAKQQRNGSDELGGYGEIRQQMIHTSESDVVTMGAMQQHLEKSLRVVKSHVAMFNRTWKFEDICFRLPLDVGDSVLARVALDYFSGMIPCLVITPLDCFWEGSKVIELTEKLKWGSKYYTWKNIRPSQYFQELIDSMWFEALKNGLRYYRDMLVDAGVTEGYTTRYCLDPYDPECPKTAPNYRNKTDPPVKELMEKGCTGFSTEFMKWPKDLVVSTYRASADSDKANQSRALQSLFHLMSAEDLYNKYEASYKHEPAVKRPEWTREMAKAVLDEWQRKFAQGEVFAEDRIEVKFGPKYDRSTLRGVEDDQEHADDKFFGVNEASLANVIEEFSSISPMRVAGGYLLMLVYAFVTLWKASSYKSLGFVSMVGVVLIAASVASGLGLTSLLGISFNAASIQVLPFLLLGLGVDDMFLLACHFSHVSMLGYIPTEKRVAECMKRVGVSVLLTSISIMAAFLCSLVIPMPALRAFSIQAAVVTLFNNLVVLITFPALLSLDFRRRLSSRFDLFCCFKSSAPNPLRDQKEFYDNMNNNNSSKATPKDLQVVCQQNSNSRSVAIDCPSSPTPLKSSTSPQPDQESIQVDSSTKNLIRTRRRWFTDLSFDKIVEKYYGPFLLRREVKICVLLLSAALLGFSVMQSLELRNGLDLTDVIPYGTKQHESLAAQQELFSFYPVYINTLDFHYGKHQDTLEALHSDITDSEYIIRNSDGTKQKFWLEYFRAWLQKVQASLDADWAAGNYQGTGADSKTALKMLYQTGDPSDPVDYTRVGCLDGSYDCERPNIVRLVDDDGWINSDAFYSYLTVWFSEDKLSMVAAQATIVPDPPTVSSGYEIKPAKVAYVRQMYQANGLRENEDFVKLIEHVRNACESREGTGTDAGAGGFSSYPSGYPFLFWQQYIDLKYWLILSLVSVLATIFVILSLVLMNPYTALLVTGMLVVILIEMFGYMGLMEVKLSALPAVTLVATVGIGLEFIMHLVLAFITTTGERNYRVIQSLSHTTAPVVDGAISTLLGVIMLAGARFDFIIKYFFQVLCAQIVLGVFNGLVLLPVLLSLVGPRSDLSWKKSKREGEEQAELAAITIRSEQAV